MQLFQKKKPEPQQPKSLSNPDKVSEIKTVKFIRMAPKSSGYFVQSIELNRNGACPHCNEAIPLVEETTWDIRDNIERKVLDMAAETLNAELNER